MFTLLVILSCIAGVLLVGAVLIQPGKGDLSAGFGGVGGQFGSMIGMRRAADFIMKATIGLAISIMIFALASNTVFKPTREEGAASPFENVETSSQTVPSQPPPVQTNQQQAPADGQQSPAGGQQAPASGGQPAPASAQPNK